MTPDFLHLRTDSHPFRTMSATLWLAGSLGVVSCGYHKAPRVFTPPPVAASAPLPVPSAPAIDVPDEIAFEPSVYDFPAQTDSSLRLPGLPPRPPRPPVANVPKPPPPPSEPPPVAAPKLAQILTPEESRRNNLELEQSTERVKKALATVAGRNLSPELRDVAERVRTYLLQAEQARDQDLVTAVNLARRADLLAKDLLERLP
jgi:hypothetical protein